MVKVKGALYYGHVKTLDTHFGPDLLCGLVHDPKGKIGFTEFKEILAREDIFFYCKKVADIIDNQMVKKKDLIALRKVLRIKSVGSPQILEDIVSFSDLGRILIMKEILTTSFSASKFETVLSQKVLSIMAAKAMSDPTNFRLASEAKQDTVSTLFKMSHDMSKSSGESDEDSGRKKEIKEDNTIGAEVEIVTEEPFEEKVRKLKEMLKTTQEVEGDLTEATKACESVLDEVVLKLREVVVVPKEKQEVHDLQVKTMEENKNINKKEIRKVVNEEIHQTEERIKQMADALIKQQDEFSEDVIKLIKRKSDDIIETIKDVATEEDHKTKHNPSSTEKDSKDKLQEGNKKFKQKALKELAEIEEKKRKIDEKVDNDISKEKYETERELRKTRKKIKAKELEQEVINIRKKRDKSETEEPSDEEKYRNYYRRKLEKEKQTREKVQKIKELESQELKRKDEEKNKRKRKIEEEERKRIGIEDNTSMIKYDRDFHTPRNSTGNQEVTEQRDRYINRGSDRGGWGNDRGGWGSDRGGWGSDRGGWGSFRGRGGRGREDWRKNGGEFRGRSRTTGRSEGGDWASEVRDRSDGRRSPIARKSLKNY